MNKSITPEMYAALKKALPSEAVTKHPTKTYLSSIKAIFVTERLNDVFGCGSWSIQVEKIEHGEKGMIVVKVILQIPEYGVYYESFGGNDNGGEASKNFDLGDAYKGASTDAITKIASYMGIGISVFKGQGNITPLQTQQQPKQDQKPVEPTTLLSKENEKMLIQSVAMLETVDSIDKVISVWNSIPELQGNKVFKTSCTMAKERLTTKIN